MQKRSLISSPNLYTRSALALSALGSAIHSVSSTRSLSLHSWNQDGYRKLGASSQRLLEPPGSASPRLWQGSEPASKTSPKRWKGLSSQPWSHAYSWSWSWTLLHPNYRTRENVKDTNAISSEKTEQRGMWGVGGGRKQGEALCVYNWSMLSHSRNWHNSVKQLYSS